MNWGYKLWKFMFIDQYFKRMYIYSSWTTNRKINLFSSEADLTNFNSNFEKNGGSIDMIFSKIFQFLEREKWTKENFELLLLQILGRVHENFFTEVYISKNINLWNKIFFRDLNRFQKILSAFLINNGQYFKNEQM